MKGKGLLALLLILTILVVVVVLFFGIFKLMSAEEFYKNENDEFIDNSQSDYFISANDLLSEYMGRPLVLISDQEVIDYIEVNNPRIRVIDVVQVFPRSIRLYLAERKPMFYINYSGHALVVDRSMRVIDVVPIEYMPTSVIEYKDINVDEIKVGELGQDLVFQDSYQYKLDIINDFSACMELLRTSGEFAYFVNSVSVNSNDENEGGHTMCIQTSTGSIILIDNPGNELQMKIEYAYATYNSIETNNKVSKFISVNDNLNVTTADMGD